jgi:hypothetical protein
VEQLGGERGAPLPELIEHGALQPDLAGCEIGWIEQERHPIPREEGDASVTLPQRSEAHPHDLASRTQLVEHTGLEAWHARRENHALQFLEGERQPFQPGERLAQTRLARALGRARGDLVQRIGLDTVPAWKEARQDARCHGRHLAAQTCQGAATNPAEHLDLTPLLASALGVELSLLQPPAGFEAGQQRLHLARNQREALGDLATLEGDVGSGVPDEELLHRLRGRLEKRAGKVARQREGVAVDGRVLGGDPALAPADPDLQCAPGAGERSDPWARVLLASGEQLVCVEIPDASQ